MVRYEELEHEVPELERLLPDSYAGQPLLKTSFRGSGAIGNEDLYLGVWPVLADELLAGPDPNAALDRIEIAEGFFTVGGANGVLGLYRDALDRDWHATCRKVPEAPESEALAWEWHEQGGGQFLVGRATVGQPRLLVAVPQRHVLIQLSYAGSGLELDEILAQF